MSDIVDKVRELSRIKADIASSTTAGKSLKRIFWSAAAMM